LDRSLEREKVILEEFMPVFGENFKTTKWENEDAFANRDTASFFGLLAKSNQETKEFPWALSGKSERWKNYTSELV